MDSDWDLHAVVRGCSSAVSSGDTTAGTWPLDVHCQQKPTFHVDNNNLMGFFFTDLFQPRNDNSIEQFLNDLYNPLRFQKLQNTPPCSPSLPISSLSVLGGLQDPSYHQQKQSQGKQQCFGISRCTTSHAQSTTKVKKRKNQMKRVCQVPAEGSSSDLWSWRKYGQKPIKGSPYPRGYYKCSTSKGCMARKQVERNRSDPGMLIVTYTGDHNHPMPTHRNALAGGSRSKPTTSGEDDTNTNKPTSSSPVSPATTLSPATEKTEENERDDTDDDNNFAVSDVLMEEDFFDGLDELVGSTTGDSFSDHLPPSTAALPFPWLSNNVAAPTTTVAGGS